MNQMPTSSVAGQRGKRAAAHHKGRGAPAKCRGLLALDGAQLTPDVLSAAESRCLQVADRVDILLVNPRKEPTAMLHGLLEHLEWAGVDYRLTSASGNLGDQVASYLRRFVGITVIVVATLPALGTDWDMKVADLRFQGYHFSTFIGQGPK